MNFFSSDGDSNSGLDSESGNQMNNPPEGGDFSDKDQGGFDYKTDQTVE